MPAAEVFWDTNVLLYLLSADVKKAERVERLLAEGGVISVQVLNEFASVARRKLGLTWAEIREVLSIICAFCNVLPVTVETHEQGLEVAERYGFSVYDAMILASALLSGCTFLATEDLQDGQRIEGRLAIFNPFN